MPTPLGHALGGMAAGWVLSGLRAADTRTLIRHGALFAVLGMLPDADLLVTAHRGPSHSVGAAAVAGLAVWAATRQARFALACACAYATHAVLDWASADSSVPRGVMAWWPFSREYYQSPVEVFASVWRRKETPDFWAHNIKAVLRELAILIPIALVAWWRVSTYRTPGRSSGPDARPQPFGAAAGTDGTSDPRGRRAGPA